MRPLLLDLYCGAGGAAKGYHRAGFDVVGYDIQPQPHYPFEFRQVDALVGLRALLRWDHPYVVIHASPPCQAFTQMSARWRGKGGPTDDHVDLLTPTLAMLRAEFVNVVWIVENVVGAKHMMRTDVMLHGGMFGLGVHRPRRFESNAPLVAEKHSKTPFPLGVYGARPDGRTTYRYRNNGNMKGKSLIRAAKSIEEAREAMGIDWMDWREICESIPPTYTEFLGRQLLKAL